MIVEVIAMVSAPAATALGVYNAARFVRDRVAEKRRKAKAAKSFVGQMVAMAKYAKRAADAVSDGIDPEEAKKINAIVEGVKAKLAAAKETPAEK